MPFRVLGIDPGLQHTGWGIVESDGSALRYIASGTVHPPTSSPLSTRLAALYEAIREVLDAHTIDEAAIEETFVNKNALSSLKLGHARGVLMMAVSLAAVPLSEYAATTVKKSLVGVGRAQKGQVAMMVKTLMPTAVIDGEDAADALAVAICHVHHAGRRHIG